MSKTDIKEWQNALHAAGHPPGAVDGDFGPATLKASLASLEDQSSEKPPVSTTPREIPIEWLPASSKMQRIIAHWTAGSHTVSKTDKEHYHFIWNADGDPVRGDRPVTANESTGDNDGYAAHTKNCNTGSIGVSMACMAGAIENPFNAGEYPMTKVQWDHMCMGIAELCEFYNIPVTDSTVLSHGEVEETLDINQDGKWDFTRLAWDLTIQGAHACGERMRSDVSKYLSNL